MYRTPDQIAETVIIKLAAVYTASGESVQGVGLRKMYNSLLQEGGYPGVAVNNEETGDVELSFHGPERDRRKVFAELARRIKAKTGNSVRFRAARGVDATPRDIQMSRGDLERLSALHYAAWLTSNKYDPADRGLNSARQLQEQLADRFRLEKAKGTALRGQVPARAYEQLTGDRPMYDFMLPSNHVRSMDEAYRDMLSDAERRKVRRHLETHPGFLGNR